MKAVRCAVLLAVAAEMALMVLPGQASPAVPLIVPPVSRQANDPREPDFNGDGFADLAVGGSFQPLAGDNVAGVLNVVYGSKTGLSATPAQWFTELDFGPEAGSSFGYPLTTG